MAIKSTYGVVNGEKRELFKDPVTDSGTKKSAKGLLRVLKNFDTFILVDQQESDENSCLETVYEDGILTRETTLEEIRTRLMS